MGALLPWRPRQAEEVTRVNAMNPLYATITAVAGVASATAAVLHGSIDTGTYAAIVMGALGISGVTHVKTSTP